jgi:hypothetical protein
MPSLVKFTALTLGLTGLVLSLTACAQNMLSPTKTTANPSPEKRALIHQFLEVTHEHSNAEMMSN